jgi:2-methylcitrate dehydratase PrpD
MGEGMGVTRQVAEFVAGTRFDDLPEAAIVAARRLIVESFAVSILGGTLTAGKAIASATGFGGSIYALGNPEDASSVARAAFVNTAWADTNDAAGGSYKSPIHPGKNVLPAVLAMGLAENRPGRDVMTAAILGIECSFRLDAAIGLEHISRGHYSDGTFGAIGAAIAVGRLRGLTADVLESAIGNAGLMAPCTVGGANMWTATGRALALGQAASAGIVAVQMAEAGIPGPREILECEGGVGQALAGATDLSRVTRDLGTVWECTSYYLKPYIGCRLTHVSREGIQHLRRTRDFRPEEVEAIRVSHPIYDLPIVAHHARAGADVGNHASSEPYLLANVLLYDDQGPAVLSDERMADPAVHALADRIEAVEDPELTAQYAGGMESRAEIGIPMSMEIRLRSGEVRTHSANRAKGDPFEGWELTDKELDEKFRTYVAARLDRAGADRMIGLVRSLDQLETMAELRQALGS